MSKGTKKICLFIVEGIADQDSLALPLKNIFAHVYHGRDVEFQITYGDITSNREITAGEIVSQVGKTVKQFLLRNKLKQSDIYQVIQIVDMDGAYIEDKFIISDEKQSYDKYPYYTDTNIIAGNAMKIAGLQKRNNNKAANLNRLITLPKIMKIPYQIYYFSCNMDHVFQNEANLDDKLKDKKAFAFAKRYRSDMEGFMQLLSSAYPADLARAYKVSWKYVKTENHSLERGSNFILFFDNDRGEIDDHTEAESEAKAYSVS